MDTPAPFEYRAAVAGLTEPLVVLEIGEAGSLNFVRRCRSVSRSCDRDLFRYFRTAAQIQTVQNRVGSARPPG
jgi:hypothetical protein